MREEEWRSKKHVRDLRRNMTEAEEKLWLDLRGGQVGGFKFRRQHPIGDYIADFACIAEKLIVEIDGATHSTAEEQAYDRSRTTALSEKGWRVIRFKNHDVYDDLDNVVETIYHHLTGKL